MPEHIKFHCTFVAPTSEAQKMIHQPNGITTKGFAKLLNRSREGRNYKGETFAGREKPVLHFHTLVGSVWIIIELLESN